MTIVTDNVQVKNGTDFTFICGKVPFAITCSSRLQHGNYNLIDMDLVNKMKIPIQKIKVCRMTYLGENLRSVGYIDQTVHCVHNGVVQGIVHLSAKVIRNLFDVFDVDCIAEGNLQEGDYIGSPVPAAVPVTMTVQVLLMDTPQSPRTGSSEPPSSLMPPRGTTPRPSWT